MNTAILKEKMTYAFTSSVLSVHKRVHERDTRAMFAIFEYFIANPMLMQELADRNEFMDGNTGELIESVSAGVMPTPVNPSEFLEDMCYVYAIEMATHE